MGCGGDKVKDVEMGRLSRWAQRNHKHPYKEDTRGSKSERNVWMEAEVREVNRCYVTGFEVGERSHELKIKTICGL